MRRPAVVEILARAQSELLAQQRCAARAQQRRKALLGAQRPERRDAVRLRARAARWMPRGQGSARACSQRPSATCSPSPQPALITSAWAGETSWT